LTVAEGGAFCLGHDIKLLMAILANLGVEIAGQTKKAASSEAAVPDVYHSSVKLVAGARSHLYQTYLTR